MHDEEDALDPALALLQEVPEGEGRLLPHLAVDPVERVALGHGRHGEVGVLGNAALGAVVERDGALGARLAHDERALEQEERLVEALQAEAQHAHVGAHAKRVGQRGHPVDDLLVGVGDEALADLVLALEQEVEYAAQRAVGQHRLLVQVHDPVVVAQHVHVVLERVLESARLVAAIGLGAVRGGHDDLAHARVLRHADGLEVHGLVGDHFDDELVEAEVEARVHVAHDVLAHELRVVAARDHAYADEGRQERRAAYLRPLREDVVEQQAAHVAHAQRQRQEAQEAEQVEHDGEGEAVVAHRVDRVALEVHLPDADAAGAQLERHQQRHEARHVQPVAPQRFVAQHVATRL